MSTETVPAEAFPPGEHLRDELAERGWTVSAFAELIGQPPQVVEQILEAKTGVTPELAQRLSAALGTSAQLWLNLQETYRLHQLR